jgi:glyoxylase I family protein
MASVHHFALVCRDRLAMERFYTKHFGFERVRVFNPGGPDEFVMTRLGGVCLEFFEAKDAAASGPSSALGFKHICFEVDRIEPVVEGLNADGVQTGPIEDCSEHAAGLRACFFTDPDGNTIEILDGWSDQANPPRLHPAQ